MNGWAILFFLLIIAALVLFVILQRRKPDEADAIASTADGWYKRMLAKIRR